MRIPKVFAGGIALVASLQVSLAADDSTPATRVVEAERSLPAWTTAWRRPPFSAAEAREFIGRLTRFIAEHHLKRRADSPQRGMVYEYRDMRAKSAAEFFVQGEALDTMHDGAWLAAAMTNAYRATRDPAYRQMLTRWQLPFYLRMLNGSDALFSTSEVHVRPERRDVWSRSKVWLLQEGERGFVPYWWDDGASISLERYDGEPLPPYPCYDGFLHRGVENPRHALHGYSLGCSNHLAQDLAVMLQTSWLLLRGSDVPAEQRLATALAEGASHLHESRIRHHGYIPMCVAAAALARRDEQLLARVPDPESAGYWRPNNAYWRGLYEAPPGRRVSLPGFADDAQYDYYHGLARAAGELPEPLAFRLVYVAVTTPLLYRYYCDDVPAPPGIHRFDLHPYHLLDGRLADYRSDRKGPGGGPRPLGSRLGPQNMIVCGWALQAMAANPAIWDQAIERHAPDDLLVPLHDEVLGPRPVGQEAVLRIGEASLILSASRTALRVHGSCPSEELKIRIHARPNAEGHHAELRLGRRGEPSAVNDRGDSLVLEGGVEPSGDGFLFRLDLPYTVVKGQARWANGVELGRYSIVVGDDSRNICLASSADQVRALLRRELAGGLRIWEAIFDRYGYVPAGIGAGRAGAGGRWQWEQFSDSGGYAHLISAAAQWIFWLTKQRDWELLGVARSDQQRAGEDETRLGYILELPAETDEARQERLALVRRRRDGVPILVHRGASAVATENTLEAYSAALDRGADGIEVDIRGSRDGVLYCLHDSTLDRTTDSSGSVRDLSYHEILEAGVRSFSRERAAPRIPTFAAVLSLARRRAALLHLDVKESGLELAIERLLDEGGLWPHVVMINPGNAERLCAHPSAQLLSYKGWFPEGDQRTPEAVATFLQRAGDMVFCKDDPAPVARAMGRTVPEEATPVPSSLRIEWSPVGPVPIPRGKPAGS